MAGVWRRKGEANQLVKLKRGSLVIFPADQSTPLLICFGAEVLELHSRVNQPCPQLFLIDPLPPKHFPPFRRTFSPSTLARRPISSSS